MSELTNTGVFLRTHTMNKAVIWGPTLGSSYLERDWFDAGYRNFRHHDLPDDVVPLVRADEAQQRIDQLRHDLESLQDSLDEQHEVVVPHAAASLPEPDATNPVHLRWCADIVDLVAPNDALDPIALRALADRLDAARTVEREREQRIETVAQAILDFENSQFDHNTGRIHDITPLEYARALDAAGLLRGGGRDE